MLDFNKMMSEINKDISSEGGTQPPTLEQQAEKINNSVDKLNDFVNTVSEEFTKKFQEMHEIYFDYQNNNTSANPTTDVGIIEEEN